MILTLNPNPTEVRGKVFTDVSCILSDGGGRGGRAGADDDFLLKYREVPATEMLRIFI